MFFAERLLKSLRFKFEVVFVFEGWMFGMRDCWRENRKKEEEKRIGKKGKKSNSGFWKKLTFYMCHVGMATCALINGIIQNLTERMSLTNWEKHKGTEHNVLRVMRPKWKEEIS